MKRRAILFCVALSCLAASSVAAAAEVAVLLAGQGQARGEVDARTDDNRLWLRREEAGLQLISGYPWRNVLLAEMDGHPISADDLRRQAARLSTPARPPHQVAPRGEVVDRAASSSGHSSGAPAWRARAAHGRVESLRISAALEQWDNDPLPDGLLVRIAPLDAHGRLVPIRGELQLWLHGQAVPLDMGVPTRLAPKWVELERVGTIVCKDDFADGPAARRLTFDRFQPERDVNVDWSTLLRARLGVPGQGVFEATLADVAVREFSPFRDDLQQRTRQRFMPFETDGLRPIRP